MYIFSRFLSAVVSQKYSVLQCGNTGVMSIKSWVCMEFCQDSATDENPKFFFYYPPQKYWCFFFVFVIVNCSNNHIFHTAMCWFSQPILRLMLNILSSLSIVFEWENRLSITVIWLCFSIIWLHFHPLLVQKNSTF